MGITQMKMRVRKDLGLAIMGLLLFLICCQSSEAKLANFNRESAMKLLEKIFQLKLAMAESEVRSIVGAPQSSEKAPFKKNSLPFKNPSENGRQKYKNLLQSVKRDHYMWRFFISSDTIRLYYLDVYYDNRSKVSYLHDWSGMSWTATEY
jgi:hypothetical protein